jgi:hypothetical protein
MQQDDFEPKRCLNVHALISFPEESKNKNRLDSLVHETGG